MGLNPCIRTYGSMLDSEYHYHKHKSEKKYITISLQLVDYMESRFIAYLNSTGNVSYIQSVETAIRFEEALRLSLNEQNTIFTSLLMLKK